MHKIETTKRKGSFLEEKNMINNRYRTMESIRSTLTAFTKEFYESVESTIKEIKTAIGFEDTTKGVLSWFDDTPLIAKQNKLDCATDTKSPMPSSNERINSNSMYTINSNDWETFNKASLHNPEASKRLLRGRYFQCHEKKGRNICREESMKNRVEQEHIKDELQTEDLYGYTHNKNDLWYVKKRKSVRFDTKKNTCIHYRTTNQDIQAAWLNDTDYENIKISIIISKKTFDDIMFKPQQRLGKDYSSINKNAEKLTKTDFCALGIEHYLCPEYGIMKKQKRSMSRTTFLIKYRIQEMFREQQEKLEAKYKAYEDAMTSQLVEDKMNASCIESSMQKPLKSCMKVIPWKIRA